MSKIVLNLGFYFLVVMHKLLQMFDSKNTICVTFLEKVGMYKAKK